MHNIQVSFNTRVVELRDRKVKLIEDINKDVDRLEFIKFILSQNEANIPSRLEMKPDEEPEKYGEPNGPLSPAATSIYLTLSLFRLFECTKQKLGEFQKQLETNPNLVERDNTSGFGLASKKKSDQALDSSTSETLSHDYLQALKADNVKPLWHNKENMSAVMIKKAKLEEIKYSN
jgi:hypothetical protein